MTPHHRRLGAALVAVVSLVPFFAAPSAGAATVAQKQAQARRLAAQLDAVANRISVLDEQLNQAHLRVAQVQASLSAATDKVRITDLRVATVAERVASRAVESYVTGGGLSPGGSTYFGLEGRVTPASLEFPIAATAVAVSAVEGQAFSGTVANFTDSDSGDPAERGAAFLLDVTLLRHQIDHRVPRELVELRGIGQVVIQLVAREFDHRRLQSQA